jgi:hypothetical protein
MPRLTELKAAVDDGKTAKHLIWRSILHYLVRKENGFYGKQSEGYANEDGRIIVEPATTFYPTWEELVNSFSTLYADAEWWLTNDKFEDYLPPEHQETPQ